MREEGGRGRVYRSEHAARTYPGREPPPVSPGGGSDPVPPDGVVAEATAPAADEAGSAAGHSAVMALGSLVSRATGFLRTVVIAAALGSTLVGNAYTNAQFFPGMIYELLLGAILTSVLVPVLVRARKSDPDGGTAYTQRLLTLAVLALGVTTLLAVAAAPLLALLVTEDAPSRSLVTTLSYLILPAIFFYGVAAILTAVLNTRGHFAAPMWAPILNNLVVIATFGLYLLLFGADPPTPDRMSAGKIALIGGGTLLGIVVQAGGLVPALRRVGFRWGWRYDFRALRPRELGRLGAWMFCYVAVNQVGVVVLMRLVNAASADDDNAGLLIYNNVFLLMMMAHGIIAVSIIVALMPRMSAAAADGRYADVAADLSRGTRMSAAVLAPIAVGYAVLALPLSVTLFQWRAFTAEDAAAMAPVLLIAGLALIPFSVSQLVTFTWYALPDTKTPALVNIPVVGLRIAVQIGLFLAFSASFVAAGLMLGNAVSYVFAAAVMAWLLRRRIGRIGLREIAVTAAKVLLAGGGAAVVCLVVVRLLPGAAAPTKLQAVVQLSAGGVTIGATYVGLAVLLRLREVNEVLDLVRRRLPGR
jgi:putative peptidoglycan lipid II flippase